MDQRLDVCPAGGPYSGGRMKKNNPEQIGTVYLDPSLLRDAPVVLEIGANSGRFVEAFLSRFGGTVTAYEPGAIADRIKSRPGLTIRRQAVWKRCGKMPFCECVETPQCSSVHQRRPSRGEARNIEVDAVSLDLAMRSHEWVDFVNIDIEGAEWDILASNSIRALRRADQVCIEFHMEFAEGRTLEQMIRRLREEAWFTVHVVEDHPKRPIVWGYKGKMSPRRAHNNWMRSAFKESKFDTVLNLGCGHDGDGRKRPYSRYMKAARVIRADVEANTAADVICRAEQMPFADDVFDLVFANWMIYKTDLPASLKEVVRVLHPGGHGMFSYGLPDPNFITAITATLKSLFHVSEHFSVDYVAKRAVRRAEAILGTLRADAEEAFDLQLESPVLVLVAHWDDEMISLGHTLRTRGAGWTVACVTHRDQEPTYRAIFDRIVAACNATPVTLDIRQRERAWDSGTMERKEYTRTVRRVPLPTSLIREKLEESVGDLSRFRTVLTHSPNGDYGGHAQHKEIAKAAVEIFDSTAAVWGFNLKAGTVAIPLSDNDRRSKLNLIRLYKPNFPASKVPGREYYIRLRPESV